MDYSPYYFKYEKEPDKPAEYSAGNFYDCTCTAHAPKKKRDIGSSIVVLIIIVSMASALVFADVKTGGTVWNAVVRTFSGDTYNYYMVARGAYDNERDAVAHATVTRQAGGAGYIYNQNGKYYVALATYFTKKEAKSVCDKNDGTEIIEFKLKAGELYSGGYGKTYKTVVESCYDCAVALSDAANALDSHAMSTSEALVLCGDIRDRMYQLKSDVLDSVGDDDRQVMLAFIEPIFGGTEAVTAVADESTLVAAMRYIVCLYATVNPKK